MGAVRVDAGVLTQGQIIAPINYMSQILVELIKFANFVLVVSKGMACFHRIQKLFSMEPSLTGGTRVLDAGIPAAVSLREVSFSYSSGGENAITRISCELPPGSRIGIIGATGSVERYTIFGVSFKSWFFWKSF